MAKKFKRINRDRPYLNILDFLVKERTFLGIIMVGIIVAGISTGYGRAAMWVGFFFAAYATVANDSIQSLGTFIESNKAHITLHCHGDCFQHSDMKVIQCFLKLKERK